MTREDKELLNSFIEMIDENPPKDKKDLIIREIKKQREQTMNAPTSGNVVSLIIWYDSLLSVVDEEDAA